MIEIKNITKKIASATILDNISFTVETGEILGFLGPNGAGKTSTMKIITGFWSPTSGEVKIGKMDAVQDILKIKKIIGYLPETVPLYNEMRVFEYLKFIANIRGIPKSGTKTAIKKVVDDCGLESVIKKPIEELSKGYRQRAGLAQAIIHQPDVLILDEPTTGLDPNQIMEIRDLIKRIGRDKTVIFSTHILSEVNAVCDRVVIINNGKIAGQGTPNELITQVGAKEIIYVKIKGPRDVIKEKLKEIEEIMEITEKDKEADNIFGYELQPQTGADVREKLSMMVMRNNWSILEFNRKAIEMEEVFRELTK